MICSIPPICSVILLLIQIRQISLSNNTKTDFTDNNSICPCSIIGVEQKENKTFVAICMSQLDILNCDGNFVTSVINESTYFDIAIWVGLLWIHDCFKFNLLVYIEWTCHFLIEKHLFHYHMLEFLDSNFQNPDKYLSWIQIEKIQHHMKIKPWCPQDIYWKNLFLIFYNIPPHL